MRTISTLISALPLLALCACSDFGFGDLADTDDVTHPAATLSSQLDLSGNHVTRSAAEQVVTFQSASDAMDTRRGFSDPLPDGAADAEVAVIHAPATDKQSARRVLALTRMLRGLGLPSTAIHVEPDTELHGDAYRIDYTLARVTPPPCPDWSSAPTGSADNAPFSDLGCATATNIGQMAADPADLEGSSARVRPDPSRANAVIDLYKSGADVSVINSTSVTSGAGQTVGAGTAPSSTYGAGTGNNSGTAAAAAPASP